MDGLAFDICFSTAYLFYGCEGWVPEECQAVLNQTTVTVLWSDDVWLVTVRLVHNHLWVWRR